MTVDLDGIINSIKGSDFFKKLLQLLFPKKCVFCGKIIEFSRAADVCDECLKDITSESHVNAGFDLGPTKLGPAEQYVDGVFCALEYDGRVRSAIIRFKFGNRPFYAKTFAWIMAKFLYKRRHDFDIIIPVPVSKKRIEKRGYNQTAEICNSLGERLRVPCSEGALSKVHDTPKQSTRKGMERVKNVSGAFAANINEVAGKSVLLVDDILTTGSTLGECARILYDAGAGKVFCATLAMAVRTKVK